MLTARPASARPATHWRDALVRYLAGRLQDKDEAAEAAQEAMVRLLERAKVLPRLRISCAGTVTPDASLLANNGNRLLVASEGNVGRLEEAELTASDSKNDTFSTARLGKRAHRNPEMISAEHDWYPTWR